MIPASHIVCELDSALQNQMNAEETLTFSICVQKAGEIWNAIPDEAFSVELPGISAAQQEKRCWR